MKNLYFFCAVTELVDDQSSPGPCFDLHLMTLNFHKLKAVQLLVDQGFLESISVLRSKPLVDFVTPEFPD